MDSKETFSEKLSRFSGNAVNKMYEIAETTKTNYDIGDSKKKLVNLYSQVGLYYYDEYKDNPPEELKELFDEIHYREEEIRKYNPKTFSSSNSKFFANNSNSNSSEINNSFTKNSYKSMDDIVYNAINANKCDSSNIVNNEEINEKGMD